MAGANGNTGGNMGSNMGDNMGGSDTGGNGTMPGMGGNSSDMGGDGKDKDAAGSKDKDAKDKDAKDKDAKDKGAANDKAELMGIKKVLSEQCGEGAGAGATKPGSGFKAPTCMQSCGAISLDRTMDCGAIGKLADMMMSGCLKDCGPPAKKAVRKQLCGMGGNMGGGGNSSDMGGDGMGGDGMGGGNMGGGGNRTRREGHLAGKSCDELKGMLKVAMAKDSKGKEAGEAGSKGKDATGSKGKDATGSKGAGTKAEKKAKAKGTLKLKGAALKGAFDKFKAKGCAAAGKGKAMPAGKGKAPAPARSRRGNHTGAADMTCAQLTTAFEAKKGEARAMYAQLKQARDTCAKAGSSNTTRAARSAAAADAVDLAELSCAELEEEIASLKTQASAAGLTLEALGLTTVSGTTASGGESGAGAVAAGASALVAIAFAQLA